MTKCTFFKLYSAIFSRFISYSFVTVFCVFFLFVASGSLAAFVYQHSITPLALPIRLTIPLWGKLTVTRRMCRPFWWLRFVGRVWYDLQRKHCEHTKTQCDMFGALICSVYRGCLIPDTVETPYNEVLRCRNEKIVRYSGVVVIANAPL